MEARAPLGALSFLVLALLGRTVAFYSQASSPNYRRLSAYLIPCLGLECALAALNARGARPLSMDCRDRVGDSDVAGARTGLSTRSAVALSSNYRSGREW
jgi:hypothetical protein